MGTILIASIKNLLMYYSYFAVIDTTAEVPDITATFATITIASQGVPSATIATVWYVSCWHTPLALLRLFLVGSFAWNSK